jgi:GntR family transcriptional regulator/MocR family aminotransferase
MPEIVLDRCSRVTLHTQIYRRIAEGIRSGRIGGLLPSTRLLARLLRVSRNTVMTAYEELAAEGLIAGRQGAGMRVIGAVGLRMPQSKAVMREARYPERTAGLEDCDGNPLLLNF